MASYETMQLIINELMIDPNLSGRQLGKRLGMSHTTIENYLNRVKLSGKTVKELYAMPPGDLKATLQLTGERFTEPEDYLAVVKYMHPPRSYGNNGTHNITEAYTNLYLMKYFPEHIAQEADGYRIIKELPSNCMSQSTFKRRVQEYIKDYFYLLGDASKSTVPSLNDAGPGGQLQIDGVGDALPWVGPDGLSHIARIIVGVSTYSGRIFIKAVPNLTKSSWLQAIEDFIYQAGGVWTSLKIDNDAGLTKKVVLPNKNGHRVSRCVPHSELIAMAKYYGFDIVQAGVRRPRDKASVERAVLTVEHLSKEILQLNDGTSASAADLDDLSRQLEAQVDKYNLTVIKHLGRSRDDIFQDEEVPALQKPLPAENERFSCRAAVKIAIVNIRGYVRYRNCEYYLGTKYIGRSVLCAENGGVVKFFDFRGNFCYDTYAIPAKVTVQVKRFKHPKYFSATEKYVTRSLDDFIELSGTLPLLQDELIELCTRLWEKSKLAPVDKTAICNELFKLCNDYIAWGNRIKDTLGIINRKEMLLWSDIKVLLFQAIQSKNEDAAEKVTTNVRGADYYY